jgi:hypothetical protein
MELERRKTCNFFDIENLYPLKTNRRPKVSDDLL